MGATKKTQNSSSSLIISKKSSKVLTVIKVKTHQAKAAIHTAIELKAYKKRLIRFTHENPTS